MTDLDYARKLAALIREIRAQPDGNFSGEGEVWVGPYIVSFGYSDDDPVKVYTLTPVPGQRRNDYTEVPDD